MSPAQWEIKAEACRQILQKSLNPEWLLPPDQLPPASQLNVSNFIESCGQLTPRELQITASTAAELTSQMAEGKLTAVETVTAFLKRGHIAHQLVNFATEFMVEDALAAAEELDAHFKKTGKLVGPLHGVPISAKEHMSLKGRRVHSGYVAWADNVADADALVIRLAKAAGAVFHVRTNEPQSVMHLDCSNPIYGTTVNPYNRNLTSGGSSGGEGASLGLRCAVMGIGTDIGGSVRVPAAFCGSYGIRTTAMRNPYKGVCIPGLGQESIRCVLSPLANSIADLDLFQKVIIDQEPWEEETQLVPLPWKRREPYKTGDFTLGVIWDDGMAHPHPPVTRALKHAVAKLKDAGIKVVDFEPYNHKEGAEIIQTLYFPDAAATQRELLEKGGEPVAFLTEWAFAYSKPEPLSIRENWELNVRRDNFRDAYHKTMKDRGVDFILCPAYVGPPARLGEAQYWHYTTIWNILDQPSMIFPTGIHVDPAIDLVEEDYKPRSAEDEREYKKYTPEDFKDAPIALQLAGKHFRDEDTIAASEMVSRIIQHLTKSPIDSISDSDSDQSLYHDAEGKTEDKNRLYHLRFRGRRLTASEKHASQGQSPPSPTPSSSDELSLVSFGIRELPEIEHDLSHHYLNVLVTALLLPTVTEADLEDYGTQVMGMMMSCDSVKYAVLANSASNKFMLTKNCRYHSTALRYYLRAIESVNRSLLDLGSSHESPSDTLLTTVVYLYLYNFWGADTSLDARKHVDGAMSLLKLRYEDKISPLSMSSTLHRLATESVLYQAFLLAARKPFAPNFHIDPQFMAQSESFLDNKLINTLFSDSSLVLGLPLRLYRLITVIIDLLNSPEHPSAETVTRLLQEIKPWEEFVTTDTTENGSYSVTSQEDIDLVKLVLYQMRDRMGYGEIQRIIDDLMDVWSMRERATVDSQ
ncbi:putative amidase [Colletotrichum siamense]|uniref:amidase n=1 Tax=Colletotrichum siamense TaxID=690259 RepID=A0A9P5ESW6_COLSI|nr:putative amidase [Colletotrichum siamense]KAF4859298.1 putative amidase [Colletotrichum siamense]